MRVNVDAAGVEVELIADQLATGQVDQGVGQGDQHWDLGLQLLGVGLEREGAVAEHDTTRDDVDASVHLVLDLEFSDRLMTGLQAVFWVLWGILLEFELDHVA